MSAGAGWVRSGRGRVGTIAIATLVAAGAGSASYLYLPEPPIVRASSDWRSVAAPPAEERSVYWVGHSLINARDEHREDARNLMEEVGWLANAAGLSYTFFDHTVWGSPLSLNWSGHAHVWGRSEPELVRERRRELDQNGHEYDVLVMTEGVSVRETAQYEFTSYYAQKFYCSISRANPDARVYMYESWTGLTDSEDGSTWEGRLREDRPAWERVSDEATAARVPGPSRLDRLLQWISPAERECDPRYPIFIIPAGTAFGRLNHALQDNPESFRMYDGDLTIDRFFANPNFDGPRGQTRRYPDAEPDDIHPSWLGVYFVALVHFATLYRRSPIGLPAPADLPPPAAEHLQRLVWDVVSNDPRTGVASDDR